VSLRKNMQFLEHMFCMGKRKRVQEYILTVIFANSDDYTKREPTSSNELSIGLSPYNLPHHFTDITIHLSYQPLTAQLHAPFQCNTPPPFPTNVTLQNLLAPPYQCTIPRIPTPSSVTLQNSLPPLQCNTPEILAPSLPV
jgi:hypothetical protein